MKIIFSRKGFDSEYGGIPSPVLPDGTMLSMPIPSEDEDRYENFSIYDMSYKQILSQLNCDGTYEYCHMDPDIRFINRTDLPKGWVPAFGQIGDAQTHLKNHGVQVGDLFLFFGWFRKTEMVDGILRYVRGSKDAHMLYGYLQIGEIVTGAACYRYSWHPHAANYVGNNTIYVASRHLIIDGEDTGLPGAGLLRWSRDIVLTKEGETRSRWDLPYFFRDVGISYHNRASFENGYFQTVKRGQEFVVNESPEVTAWAKEKILKNYDDGGRSPGELALIPGSADYLASIGIYPKKKRPQSREGQKLTFEELWLYDQGFIHTAIINKLNEILNGTGYGAVIRRIDEKQVINICNSKSHVIRERVIYTELSAKPMQLIIGLQSDIYNIVCEKYELRDKFNSFGKYSGELELMGTLSDLYKITNTMLKMDDYKLKQIPVEVKTDGEKDNEEEFPF